MFVTLTFYQNLNQYSPYVNRPFNLLTVTGDAYVGITWELVTGENGIMSVISHIN